MVTVIDLYNAAVSFLSGVGLLYLLYSGRYVVGYRRFFLLITFGLFVSLLGGSFLVVISESVRHAIHGVATLFIAVGLYDLVRTELGVDEQDDWVAILFEDSEAFDLETAEFDG